MDARVDANRGWLHLLFTCLGRLLDQEVYDDVAERGLQQRAHGGSAGVEGCIMEYAGRCSSATGMEYAQTGWLAGLASAGEYL